MSFRSLYGALRPTRSTLYSIYADTEWEWRCTLRCITQSNEETAHKNRNYNSNDGEREGGRGMEGEGGERKILKHKKFRLEAHADAADC